MKRMLMVAAFLWAVLLPGTVAAQCLEYEPQVVTLAGTLVRENHAGPPNYESIRRGDKPETIWVLRLRKPICVTGLDDINVREDNQRGVQLALEPGQYKKYRRYVGQRVVVTGKLFHAHTGHHHKQLLLTTKEIRNSQIK